MQSEDEQKTIEAEFSQSWDGIERFFSDLTSREGLAFMLPIHNLLADLRRHGYDRQFRVGQSTYIFVLSRSRRHHLRPEQSSLVFELKAKGGMRIRYRETGNLISEFEVERVEITPEIEALLERLLAQPID